jgi:hypothetical protein
VGKPASSCEDAGRQQRYHSNISEKSVHVQESVMTAGDFRAFENANQNRASPHSVTPLAAALFNTLLWT